MKIKSMNAQEEFNEWFKVWDPNRYVGERPVGPLREAFLAGFNARHRQLLISEDSEHYQAGFKDGYQQACEDS